MKIELHSVDDTSIAVHNHGPGLIQLGTTAQLADTGVIVEPGGSISGWYGPLVIAIRAPLADFAARDVVDMFDQLEVWDRTAAAAWDALAGEGSGPKYEHAKFLSREAELSKQRLTNAVGVLRAALAAERSPNNGGRR